MTEYEPTGRDPKIPPIPADRMRLTLDLLFQPLGLLFLGLARIRARLYLSGALRRRELEAPCISVGNLTFGGTGKTPFTVYLANRALDLGFHPAILTRGYGRKTSGAVRVLPDSAFESVGDEALLTARSLPEVPVLVAARRELAADLAPAGTDLFILDDGFQHLRLRRDRDLVLLDLQRPGDLRPPPMGRLREPLSALRRAHLLVLTRGRLQQFPRRAALFWAGRPRVAVRFLWEDLVHPQCSETWADMAGRPLAAFAGTAHPRAFFEQARGMGLLIRETVAFPDHAEPTEERERRIRDAVQGSDARAVLCTEKDAAKWESRWNHEIPLVYPKLRAEVEDPSGALERLLLSLRAGRGGDR